MIKNQKGKRGRKKGSKNKELPPVQYGERVIYHIPEAAKVLRVHESVIRGAIARKILKASKIGGRWKIDSDDLDNYFKRMRKYTPSKKENTANGN